MVGKATADYCEAVPDEPNDAVPDTGVDSTAVVSPTSSVDLDAIETDLAAVETALARLDAGTYWTDEVTGAPLDADLLEQNPLLRHLAP